MDPDVRRIDEEVFEIRIIRQCLENSIPDAFLRPSPKSRIDRIPLAEVVRQITPGGAGPRNPQHCFDKQPIVACGDPRITNLAWQLGRNPFPLLVVENRANQG